MEPIRLIRDKSELESTCYFEFLPGQYRDQCWNDGSLFLAEEVFTLIERVIARQEPGFDHYSFVMIGTPAWQRILADLDGFAAHVESATGVDDLRETVRFLSTDLEEEFATDFRANADALAGLSRELAAWLREQLQRHECVSVLGM